MVNIYSFRIVCVLIAIFAIASCNLTKHVPEDKYLLVSNELIIPDGTEIKESKARSVIRQKPNHRTLGLRLRLRAYNMVDSTAAAKAEKRRFKRYKKINRRRLKRQEKINERRIQRALERGDSTYRKKEIDLKDTINPKPTPREKLKYDYGEPPKLFDSSAMETSREQLQLFLQKNGYFDGTVEAHVNLDKEEQTAVVEYVFHPKEPYIVDSMRLETSNEVIRSKYEKYREEGKNVLETPFRFDTDALGDMRRSMAEFMRNEAIYGFKDSYVSYLVDTLSGGHKINIVINIAERKVEKEDGMKSKPFAPFKINKVYFHLRDTMTYDGNFYEEEILSRNMTLTPFDPIPTFDTMRYDDYEGRNSEIRTATILYNGKPMVRPELLEFQNYLEETNFYKEDFAKQSYSRLLQTDLFESVQYEIVENKDNTLDVHYYLKPQKKQRFSFEPKGTHSLGFLGIQASVNYINKNLFRTGSRLKISFSGGVESQPDVFRDDNESNTLNQDISSFNTLEFGPSVQLDIPGLFPIPLTKLSKRQNPRTTFSAAYNRQDRPEFQRRTFQLNYLWKFYDVYRTQVFTVGIPIIGGVQFVNIEKSTPFEQRLEAQNDLFLINAYSNQSIWKDLKVSYQWSNQERKKGNVVLSYAANLDVAGLTIALLTKDQPVNDEGFREFLGIRYSEFVRLDNEFRLHHNYSEKQSMNYRIQVGGGVPLENNGPNLPFDYSFSAGGSVDNRGYLARSLGPGVYKYYLDTGRTVTEIGDMRLGGSVEYRFKITDLFEGTIFSDVGNIWTYNKDKNRPGGQISNDFYKQLSVSGGIGLRVDLSFLILRIDAGIPLRNPALPQGARWIWQDDDPYIQEGIEQWGYNSAGEPRYKELMPNVFQPRLHIAIGYPF
ncbi:MAG: BamA/TamA family outer membrane protein [Brumimicrobium sp.]|nr:BamA/TamA family outer membrane protein [Brumimicrobium sp.]